MYFNLNLQPPHYHSIPYAFEIAHRCRTSLVMQCRGTQRQEGSSCEPKVNEDTKGSVAFREREDEMTVELIYLVLSVCLGIVHLLMTSHFTSFQRGYLWTAGNREAEPILLKGLAGRLERIAGNFLETFPLFAALVLIAHVTGNHGKLSILGVLMYFWGRIAFAVIYAIGIPILRSLVWNVATIGIILIAISLLR